MPSTGLYGQVVGILVIHMTQSSCNQLRLWQDIVQGKILPRVTKMLAGLMCHL